MNRYSLDTIVNLVDVSSLFPTVFPLVCVVSVLTVVTIFLSFHPSSISVSFLTFYLVSGNFIDILQNLTEQYFLLNGSLMYVRV